MEKRQSEPKQVGIIANDLLKIIQENAELQRNAQTFQNLTNGKTI